jgi:hypothetical protein
VTSSGLDECSSISGWKRDILFAKMSKPPLVPTHPIEFVIMDKRGWNMKLN